MRLILGLTLAFLIPLSLGATTIYVYVDDHGVRHFTNIRPLTRKCEILFHGTTEGHNRSRLVPTRYDELIYKLAREHHVDPQLVKAVVMVESEFNPRAVSRKGAKGLMQIIPETQALLGLQNPFDPEENLRGGIRYLKYLLDFFENNLELALAAYNAGPQRVLEFGSIPPYAETREYVKRVIFHYDRFKNR